MEKRRCATRKQYAVVRLSVLDELLFKVEIRNNWGNYKRRCLIVGSNSCSNSAVCCFLSSSKKQLTNLHLF